MLARVGPRLRGLAKYGEHSGEDEEGEKSVGAGRRSWMRGSRGGKRISRMLLR